MRELQGLVDHKLHPAKEIAEQHAFNTTKWVVPPGVGQPAWSRLWAAQEYNKVGQSAWFRLWALGGKVARPPGRSRLRPARTLGT